MHPLAVHEKRERNRKDQNRTRVASKSVHLQWVCRQMAMQSKVFPDDCVHDRLIEDIGDRKTRSFMPMFFKLFPIVF